MFSFKLHRLITGFQRSTIRARCIGTSLTDQLSSDHVLPNNTEPTVLLEKDTNITLIGINREQSRNSIDAVTAKSLCAALRHFEEDETSPIAVLYGIGGSFSAGQDLAELEQNLDKQNYAHLTAAEGVVGPTRRHLRKPVICAINGYCVASGLELALLCDLRVMEDTAILGFFNRRLGVPLSDGGTARLAASIGYGRALELIATGRRVNAQEALHMGLINRYVATGTALGQAVNLAFSIAKFPEAALQHDRSSLYANVYKKRSFRASAQQEIAQMTPEVLVEMQQGIQRFRESTIKGATTDAWHVKQKHIPDWELEEIAHEQAHAKLQADRLHLKEIR